MAKIKKSDSVLVIAGKDKGVTGKVIDVIGDRILVQGVLPLQASHNVDACSLLRSLHCF